MISDNGTEFTSTAVLKFTQKQKLDWRHIAPGRPTRNAFAESVRGRMRDACLDEHQFFPTRQARAVILGGVHNCNTVRPPSSLGCQTPAACAEALSRNGHRRCAR